MDDLSAIAINGDGSGSITLEKEVGGGGGGGGGWLERLESDGRGLIIDGLRGGMAVGTDAAVDELELRVEKR